MKHNYVLVDSKTKRDTAHMFTGSSAHAAAMKAASRGHKKILLRRTGGDVVHEYKGSVRKLKTPKVVSRNGVDVVYTKETSVRRVA
jgi:hypothetical protein